MLCGLVNTVGFVENVCKDVSKKKHPVANPVPALFHQRPTVTLITTFCCLVHSGGKPPDQRNTSKCRQKS